jgi:hypothetical protein
MQRTRKPPTESVRIEKDLARMARMVAADEDLSVPELLSDLLRGPLTQRYHAVTVKMAKEAGQRRKAADN